MSKWQEHRDWPADENTQPADITDVYYALKTIVRVLADIGEEIEKKQSPLYSIQPTEWPPVQSNPYPGTEHQPGCNMKPVTTDGKCACGAERVL